MKRSTEQVHHGDDALVHRSEELECADPVAIRAEKEDFVEVLGNVPPEHECDALVRMLAPCRPGEHLGRVRGASEGCINKGNAAGCAFRAEILSVPLSIGYSGHHRTARRRAT